MDVCGSVEISAGFTSPFVAGGSSAIHGGNSNSGVEGAANIIGGNSTAGTGGALNLLGGSGVAVGGAVVISGGSASKVDVYVMGGYTSVETTNTGSNV